MNVTEREDLYSDILEACKRKSFRPNSLLIAEIVKFVNVIELKFDKKISITNSEVAEFYHGKAKDWE
jgi:hypothetical protein